jgi:hypothetical protein
MLLCDKSQHTVSLLLTVLWELNTWFMEVCELLWIVLSSSSCIIEGCTHLFACEIKHLDKCRALLACCEEDSDIYIRFEVFTTVTMNNAVFWDVVLCRSWVNWRFRGTYCLHLQGRKICEQGTNISRQLQTEPTVGNTSYVRTGREGV